MFIVQGKEMGYQEIVKLLDQVNKQNVLDYLDEGEVRAFFSRVMKWHEDQLIQDKQLNKDKKHLKKVFEEAKSMPLNVKKNIWQKGKELLAEPGEQKQAIMTFFKHEFIHEVKKCPTI